MTGKKYTVSALPHLPVNKLVLLILVGIIVVVIVALLAMLLPQGVDWHLAFRPAALKILAGRNPYEVEGYFNAPWALIPLLPFSLLQESVGRSALFLVGLVVYAYVAYNLGARRFAFLAFLISPPVLHGLLNANIDWLALLGFIMPPQIGLFFVSIKPQVGIGMAIYWLIEAWRRDGWKGVFHTYWPISLSLAVSFILFGFWPLRFEREVDLWWNASLWPMSIPVGLGLLAAAWRKRSIRFAMGAGPCLSPYVLLHSWAGPMVALVNYQFETVAVVAGLWILVIIRLFS